jgi:hypothetical protein
MADYYPLISRAVAGLAEDTHETRRTIYQKARKALDVQLRAVQPALSETEIARERLALDEAIGKIEAERTRTADMLSLSWMAPASDLAPVSPKEAPQESKFLKADPVPVGRERPQYGDIQAGGSKGSNASPALNVVAHPDTPPSLVSPASVAESVMEDAIERERPRMNTSEPSLVNHRQQRHMIMGAALGCTIALIAGVAIYFKDRPTIVPQLEQPAPRPTDADAKIDERLTERNGNGGAEKSTSSSSTPNPAVSSPEIPIAQKAFMYEENSVPNKDTVAFSGRTLWRMDTVSGGEGRPLETAVRADIEITDAGLTLTLLLRKNNDSALPASHILQMTFGKTGTGETRIVKDVALPQFKPDEGTRGVQLLGVPVAVSENVFLVGLSNIPLDVTRNLEMISTRMWIDIPLRFTDGRKAMLAIEKGLQGERILNEALQTWKGTP